MRVIAIDPGASTGIAIINLFPLKLKELCTVPLAQIEFQLTLFEPDVIVIEKEPAFGVREQSALVRDIMLKCSQLTQARIEFILPMEWKPIAKAKEWQQKAGQDQHQKDAYNMLRFYIFKNFNQDIGELSK